VGGERRSIDRLFRPTRRPDAMRVVGHCQSIWTAIQDWGAPLRDNQRRCDIPATIISCEANAANARRAIAFMT
jgi:hypothetical protein